MYTHADVWNTEIFNFYTILNNTFPFLLIDFALRLIIIFIIILFDPSIMKYSQKSQPVARKGRQMSLISVGNQEWLQEKVYLRKISE